MRWASYRGHLEDVGSTHRRHLRYNVTGRRIITLSPTCRSSRRFIHVAGSISYGNAANACQSRHWRNCASSSHEVHMLNHRGGFLGREFIGDGQRGLRVTAPKVAAAAAIDLNTTPSIS